MLTGVVNRVTGKKPSKRASTQSILDRPRQITKERPKPAYVVVVRPIWTTTTTLHFSIVMVMGW